MLALSEKSYVDVDCKTKPKLVKKTINTNTVPKLCSTSTRRTNVDFLKKDEIAIRGTVKSKN